LHLLLERAPGAGAGRSRWIEGVGREVDDFAFQGAVAQVVEDIELHHSLLTFGNEADVAVRDGPLRRQRDDIRSGAAGPVPPNTTTIRFPGSDFSSPVRIGSASSP